MGMFKRLTKQAFVLLSLAFAMNAWSLETTRTFIDGLGHSVQIPIQAKRIVALRGEQFTAPLIELGAPVVGSTGIVKHRVNNGLPFIRGAYPMFYTRFNEQGIGYVGHPSQPDLEAIAALKPDLILLPDFAASFYSQLSRIAPTVVINIWSQNALQRYRNIADAVGQLEAFEQRKAVFDFRLAEAKAIVAQRLGDASQVSVAVAEVNGQQLRVFKNYGAMTYLLDELGFSRPQVIEQISGDRLDLSAEQVERINADFMVSSYAEEFGQPVAQVARRWSGAVPGWNLVLHAPRHQQHLLIPRETMRALSFKGMEEVLAIYLSNIVTRDFVPLPK